MKFAWLFAGICAVVFISAGFLHMGDPKAHGSTAIEESLNDANICESSDEDSSESCRTYGDWRCWDGGTITTELEAYVPDELTEDGDGGKVFLDSGTKTAWCNNNGIEGNWESTDETACWAFSRDGVPAVLAWVWYDGIEGEADSIEPISRPERGKCDSADSMYEDLYADELRSRNTCTDDIWDTDGCDSLQEYMQPEPSDPSDE